MNLPAPSVIATKMVGFGAHCILIPEGTKRAVTPGWQDNATRDLEVVKNWTQGNVCVVGKQDGLWFLEFEYNQLGILEEYEKAYGALQTYRVRSVSGGIHLYFVQDSASRSMGNLQAKDEYGKEIFSARVDNRYVLAPGSTAHPHNDESQPLAAYTAIDISAPIIAPASLLEFLKSRAGSVKVSVTTSQEEVAHVGGRNNFLTSFAGMLRQKCSFSEAELLGALLARNQERCVPPLSTEEVKTIARSISNYQVKPTGTVYYSGVPLGTKPQQSMSIVQPQVPEAAQEPIMSVAEIEEELKKEYPRILLDAPAGPTWEDSILYGPAGDLVKKMSEYNEGHPAAIYLNFLVSLGNIFGRHAYFRIGSTRHYTNEFLAVVGPSSYGRKGSARDVVNEFLKILDPEWSKNRILSGFGSGEAIINEVRDDSMQTITVKQKGKPPKFESQMVPGVSDKRLCIRESELASVFTMASKKESLAGSIIRNGWDSNPLSNNVKGRTAQGISLSARCEQPHVSITGDISTEELKTSLPTGSEHNGFANRYLFVYGYRTKKCSNGGPLIDWSDALVFFDAVVKHAQQCDHMPFSESARTVWNRMYHEDFEAQGEEMTAKMTSRGQPHIRRLAMIFAIIDLEEEVQTRHLHAAKAVWDYCEDSARYIFSGYTREQANIYHWIRANGSSTVTRIREEFYKRNRKVDWITAQMQDLVRQGRLKKNGEEFSTEK